MPLLSVRNLSVKLGRGRPVDGVSFDIAAGETFALLGESGCGKSMTALALMRLLPDVASIERGAIEFEGRELARLDEAGMRRLRGGAMGMIFQEPATSLNPVLTIGYQIGESLAAHRGLSGAAARARAIELLDAVGIPDAARRHGEYPFQLSGGMKQRAMIAMVLAGEPRLLIADEPTTALDVTIQAQVLDLLAALRHERGMGLLLITHDLGVVSRVADRIGVMYAGQLVEVASREKFFSRPAHPYSRALFAALPAAEARGRPLATIPGRVPPLETSFSGCRFADRCGYVKDLCRGKEPPLAPVADGQYVRCYFPVQGELQAEAIALRQAQTERPITPSALRPAATVRPEPGRRGPVPLLDVIDLKVHFPIRKGVLQRVAGHVRAVDGVSLRLTTGKTLALVGESGCGKTTAGKAVLQLLRANGGSVRLNGTELTTLNAHQLRPLRAAMQMVFQDPFSSLNPRMRVGAIVAEGMRALKPHEHHQQRVSDLLQQVGLAPDMADRYPHEFSGGQRQRIAIARALAVSPQLLICDEPTSALDVSVQAQILNLLKDLQATLGLAYLFITHNIAVVDYLAQEVAVMYLGRIVERGSTDEVLRDPKHPYTQALIAAVPRIAQEREGGQAVPVAPGDIPSPARPPAGCHFHPRCPRAMEECRKVYPAATTLSETRVVHCHLYR